MAVRKQPRIFAPFEIAALFQKSKMITPSYTPLFEFYLLTGCRPLEPLRLRWKDIDFDYCVAKIRKQSKGKSISRKVYLPSHLRQQMRLQSNLPVPFPFKSESVRNAFRRIRESTHLNNVRLETLSETFHFHLKEYHSADDSLEMSIEKLQYRFLPDILTEPPPNGLAKLLKEGKL